MTIEEIRGNAPIGATHYQDMSIISRVMYYKKINGVIYWFNDCDSWSNILKEHGIKYMNGLRSRIKPL